MNNKINKLWYTYIIEFYSAIIKGMKFYHMRQHGWTGD